jgi:hypothetical protein
MACQTWLARGTESAFLFTLKILTSFTVFSVEAVCELIGPDGVLLFSVGCYLVCICFASGLHLVVVTAVVAVAAAAVVTKCERLRSNNPEGSESSPLSGRPAGG